LCHYNSDKHESILTIFGTNVMRKYAINRYLIFPPHFTGASTLPGEMQKYTNNILSLKCCTTALPDFNQSLA